MTWQPALGALTSDAGTHFRVWAPEARTVEVVLERPDPKSAPLQKNPDGTFSGLLRDVHAGDRYRYRLDGQAPFPDPVSRFQPEGVHGPSEVVDPARFAWTDAGWSGIALKDVSIYELHVGTFSPEGTFAGVTARLPYLKALGVTVVELMPLADFPGTRNWGYDGVSLFAPARCYGQPDDLRQLVDTAHGLGLAVFLDVVYNHLGPDGNYLGVYSPYYFTNRHQTDWGAALNFDAEHSEQVRRFFIENAMHWVREYHIDGLRLDATHVIMDDSPRHFLIELAEHVHHAVPGKTPLVIAEDHRNLAAMLKPTAESGWGLDAVWADDFHHQVRRLLAGDHEGYYRDFTGTLTDLARTIQQGWFYCGQHSTHLDHPRGTDPDDLPPRRFVHCIQNHDQTGNRALGERLTEAIDLASYRAATVLLLASPATPLLFMGQEWAASTPFLFFTDHHDELGRLVTEGRRKEFRHFEAFNDPEARKRIPDPQAATTFEASRLRWQEAEQPPHASILRLYQSMLRLRHTEPAFRAAGRAQFDVAPLGAFSLAVLRRAEDGPTLLIVVQLKEAGIADLRGHPLLNNSEQSWETLLTTENPEDGGDMRPMRIECSADGVVIHFDRPGAVILKANVPVPKVVS